MHPAENSVPIERPAEADVLDRLHTPVWIYDFDRTRVAWANAAALRLWRAPDLASLVDRDLGADMSPAIRARLAQYRADFEHDTPVAFEIWTLYPEGVPTTVRLSFRGHRMADGRIAMLCEALSEFVETPERIRSADALLHTSVMITLFDVRGGALYRNPASRQSRAGATEETLSERFVDGRDHDRLIAAIEAHGSALVEARVRTAGGERWHSIAARLCHDAAGGSPALLVSETDVSAHKAAEARVRYLAEHDTLTGLPNRTGLVGEIERRIDRARPRDEELAILFIDLDRFKTINDSLGHSVGDGLLVIAAGRLADALDEGDYVARLGGDEFLVCLSLAGDPGRAERVAERILQALDRPMRIDAIDLSITASIGISRFPRDGRDLETLMRHSDIAMYAAKGRGCARWASFDPTMTAEMEGALIFETQLRRALDRGEFEVFYQPRLEIGSERIIGAEALLRWHHPTRGLVMPGAFIPFAEKTGLIDRIGACVLREAALQQKAWADAGHDISISVNLSARQMRDAALAPMVDEIVREAGCDPRRLQIEITESMLLGDDPTSTTTLEALAALGLSIAVDDFGTGYSNLGTLHRHPIDTLKIDRSFVATLETRPALAELIIGMCRLLDMRMVAEGVETEEQLAWLQARNCDEYQGYLFSPAVPVDQFDEMLARQRELACAVGFGEDRSPLWELVPLVRRDGDVEWRAPGEAAKVRRLSIGGAVEAFVRRDRG